MRKLYNLFIKPSGSKLNPIMAHLKCFKAMPVKYEAALLPAKLVTANTRYRYEIEDVCVERTERMKVWQVAVTTAEPEIVFENFSAWMLHILTVHTEIVEDLSRREALERQKEMALYYQSIRDRTDLAPVKNILYKV